MKYLNEMTREELIAEFNKLNRKPKLTDKEMFRYRALKEKLLPLQR